MELSELGITIGFMFLMCWSPGPNTILCAAHGTIHGFKSTLKLIFGQGVGFFLVGMAIALSMDIIENYSGVMFTLKYVGAAYILYLSVKIAKSPVTKSEQTNEDLLGFKTGATMQLVNPKSFVYFTLLISIYSTRVGEGVSIKIMIICISTVIGIASVLFWAYFGSKIKKLLSDQNKAKKMNITLGILLALVAVNILFQ